MGQHRLLLITALPRIFYATLTKSVGQSCLQSVPLPTLRQGNAGRMSKHKLGTGTGRLSLGWFVIKFQSWQYPSVFVTPHSNLSGTTLLQGKHSIIKRNTMFCWTIMNVYSPVMAVKPSTNLCIFSLPLEPNYLHISVWVIAFDPAERRQVSRGVCWERTTVDLPCEIPSVVFSNSYLLAEQDNVSPAVAVIFRALWWVQS